MKKLLLLLVLPLSAGAASAAGAAGDAPKDWVSFQSKDGGFSVELPGKPLESRQLVKTGLGTLEVTMLLLEKKKEGAFVVSFANFPESAFKGGDDEKRLDNARDGAIATAKGKLKSEKKIMLDKWPGRELVIDSPTRGLLRTRIYAVDQRLYQTVATGSAAFINGKDVTRFLDSFKLQK